MEENNKEDSMQPQLDSAETTARKKPGPKPKEKALTLEEDIAQRRALRKDNPMGELGLKLSAEKRPGFVRYWEADIDGKVERRLSRGWTHVKKNGKNDCRSGGGNVKLYLMEIPEILAQEDQKKASAELDAVDAQIGGKPFGLTNKEKFYNNKSKMSSSVKPE